MTPERYSQVKSLFQLVLEQQPAQRPAFLERACGADRELFQQVRELLKSDSTSEDFLEKPAITPLSKVLADAAAEIHDPMPAKIGPYAVQKLIGSGGMGAVYLAYRADKSYNKQVAIKVIHRGMETDRILQRFRRERQIIASLDHPNIARLLDGGATEDGRPYIVMEYVEGMPITHYCDQRRLTTEQRLAIFLQVCDAIQYAHQNLIIHRDIKPGNILVRADNAVKLLDFGIAKLMNPDLAAAPSEKTATSMRLMTPQYASPEQVRGESVTTASDVYLLGIVLYELLTGHRPYDVPDSAAMHALRAFAEGEPQKPSDAIFRITEKADTEGGPATRKTALTVSAVREANPAALRKKLRGGLDAILLKALRRNAAERYQSTAQLAQDIRNYLAQFPVSALPDTPAYRISLFLRRNTAMAIAAASVISLLLLVTVFAVWQAASARQERLRAESRFSEVQKLSNSLLFDVQDSLGPLPGATPARRLLVNSALQYLHNLENQSAADPNLQLQIANGYIRVGHLQGNPNYSNLGDTAGAFSSYRRAESLLDGLNRQDPKNAQIANDLAVAATAAAEILRFDGDPAAAVPALRRALQLRESVNAAPEAKAASLNRLALALAGSGDTAEALELSGKAQSIAASLTGTDAPRQQALNHSRHAAVLQKTGNIPGAADSFRAALALYQQLAAAAPLNAPPKRELAAALEDLAAVEPPAEAAPHYQRALQLRRELIALDPQNMQARRDLAYSLLKQGATADARESFRQLVAIDPASSLARRDLAVMWERQGDAQRAESKYGEAVSSYRQLLQAARDWTEHDPANRSASRLLAAAHLKLANVLPRTGDTDGAIQSARAAIRLLDSLLDKDKNNWALQHQRATAQWALGRSLLEAARTANQSARWGDAETELRRAGELYSEIANRQPLIGEDRSAPAAIAAQIETCRQALAASPAGSR